ncbi:MAG: hypothetical protein GY898_20345 [Proteobacteria bacterium]|nr:hypothetical protein [Pseudomonadota bacterium]
MLRDFLVSLSMALLVAAFAALLLPACATPLAPDLGEPAAEGVQLAPASGWMVIEDAAVLDEGWAAEGLQPAL